MSNKDLIDVLKQKFGGGYSSSTSFFDKRKKSKVFSKPKSFDLTGKNRRRRNDKVLEQKKQNFVKKYSEAIGMMKMKADKDKVHPKSFYETFKIKQK